MDFQNRVGGKTGGGGVASWSESNRDRRERLRQLALETIDLNKDPYFMKNHLGILNKHTIVNKKFYFNLV
jgi:splicing factor 3A subunit 2